jgi:hypothetical protein
MECIETASVIVSTKPDEAPVMRIRKLQQIEQKIKVGRVHILSNPAAGVFLFPYTLKLPDQLGRKLFLSQVCARLDDNRDTVPVCWRKSTNKLFEKKRSLLKWPYGDPCRILLYTASAIRHMAIV